MIDDEYAKIFDLIEFKKIFSKDETKKFIEVSQYIAQA